VCFCYVTFSQVRSVQFFIVLIDFFICRHVIYNIAFGFFGFFFLSCRPVCAVYGSRLYLAILQPVCVLYVISIQVFSSVRSFANHSVSFIISIFKVKLFMWLTYSDEPTNEVR
jgi:hypothetical protein